MPDTYPPSQRSSSSHPDDFARARTTAANLATDSEHPYTRTHIPPTNPSTPPIAMFMQWYSKTAAVVRTYSKQRASTTHGGVFCKCSLQGKATLTKVKISDMLDTPAESLPAVLTARMPVNGLSDDALDASALVVSCP